MRQGYVILNQRYSEAVGALKAISLSSLEVARRAATASERARVAAARSAAIGESAAEPAVAAVVDAAAHQIPEDVLRISADAAVAVKQATESATEAARMAYLVAEAARRVRK